MDFPALFVFQWLLGRIFAFYDFFLVRQYPGFLLGRGTTPPCLVSVEYAEKARRDPV